MLRIILAAAISLAHASPVTSKETYMSQAQDKRGKAVYFEEHQADFGDGRIQTAKTLYLDNDKRAFAEMTSDFRQMLTLPQYEYKDNRDGSAHGIRLENDNVVLWRKKKDEVPEEKRFALKEFESQYLVVGCQGLHYYLISNLDEIRRKKQIPIKYMMPGALAFYSFTLKLDREDEEYIHLRLTIDNVILKMFTSALEMTYRKADRRLIKYAGISNVTDAKGRMQYVTIDYKYDGGRP